MNILTSNTVDKGNTPKDILMLRKFIENEGIEEYEKNTLNCLSEFLNTYITDILLKAKQNMTLANRNKVNIDDIKLAVKNKQNALYVNRPDIETLKQLSKEVNSVLLPSIPEVPHVLLPPIENNLLRNNFQVFSEDIAQYFNNCIEESSSIKQEEVTLLGHKRKENHHHEHKGNKKRIRLSIDAQTTQHKHRKLSLTQPYKPKKEEEDNENDDGNNNDNENENENDNENGDNEQDAIFDKEDESIQQGDAFENEVNDDIDFD